MLRQRWSIWRLKATRFQGEIEQRLGIARADFRRSEIVSQGLSVRCAYLFKRPAASLAPVKGL